MNHTLIKETVKYIIELLIAEEFKFLWLNDIDQRISPNEMASAVSGYGQMRMPPVSSFDDIESFPTDDPNVVRVDYDLWFDGMKSDLTLKCTIYLLRQKEYSIDDIRML